MKTPAKTSHSSLLPISRWLCAGLLLALLVQNARAVIYYWDPEGSVAAPTTAQLTGTWSSSSANWSTNAAGGFTISAAPSGATVDFCSGSTAPAGAFTVTVSGTVTVAGIFNGSLNPPGFNVTLSGGTISLSSGADGCSTGGSDGDGTTINSVLAGAGTLVLESGNPLYLNGVNTYTGGTDIGYSSVSFNGIVYFNNAASFGTGPMTLEPLGNGGALVVEGTSAVAITNAFAMAGSTTNNFVGNAAGVTYSGPWSLGAYQLGFGTGGSVGNTDVISGAISGTGALVVSGSGTLALSGANTYSGGTIINSGTLDARTAAALPAVGTVTTTGGALQMDNAAAMPATAILNLPALSTNTVNLNFTGTDTILALNFGTNVQALGTWGAPGSGATHTSTAFTGTGLLSVSVSSTTNLYWDANGSDASSHGNTSGGGSGNWDNSTADWWGAGGSDTAWAPGTVANFGGVAGTVTVAANVTSPDALIFSTPGYVITNSSGSTISMAGVATTISIPTGTTTISAPITGQGVLISGPGTMILNATNNNYAAGTSITNGAALIVNALADTGPSDIGAGPLFLGAGGTLNFTGSSGQTARAVTLGGALSNVINVSTGNSLELDGSVHVGTASAPQVLAFNGGGTLILGGTLDNSGLDLAINAGKVIITKASVSTAHGIGGGTTTIAGGAELQLAGTGGYDLYSACVLNIASGGLLDLNGQSDTFGTLTLPGNGSGNGVLINSSTGTASAITCSVVMNGNTTINSPGSITLGGVVSGDFALTQANTNLLTLNGANTYNGGLNVNAGGSVTIGNATGGGSGVITLGAGGTLGVNIAAGNLLNVVNGPSSAVVNVIETAADNLEISSDMLGFTGTMNCPPTAGTTAKAEVLSTAFAINPGATINVASGGTLYLANPGIVIPCAVNLYGPGNTEAYGALRLEAGAIVSGPVTLYGTSANTMGNGQSGATKSAFITGVISGTNALTFTAEPGTIVLSGANTYTNVTTLNGSVLQLASPEIPGASGPLGKSAASNRGSIVMNGGELQFASVNANDYSGRFSTNAGQKFFFDLNGQTVTFATPLASTNGALGVASSITGGKLILSAANTYSGPTTNASGITQLAASDTPGVSGPLGSSTAVGSILMTGGTLQYAAANGAHDYSSRFATNASQDFYIDVNGQAVTFASALLSTNGVLIVSSTAPGGSLTLNGTNAYTGATTINVGATLAIGGAGDLGNVLGTGTYAAAINDYGTLNFGSSANQTLSGVISGSGSLVKSGTGTLTLSSAANAYYGGTTVSNGTLYVSATGAILGNVTVAGGVLELGNGSALTPNAVLTLASVPAAGTVNLNFSGVQNISALNSGTTSMAPGTYGATGSGATYQSAAFTGTGILNVMAQTAYWDPSPSLDAAPGSGGSGSWDTTTTDWFTGSSDAAWGTNDVATFAGSAGTVSVNANINASGLMFATSGYTLGGGSTITLYGSTNSSTPMIAIPSGTTTISATLASSNAANTVIISGPGTLDLTGANTFTNNLEATGGATLSAGTISDSGSSGIGLGTNITLLNANLSSTGSYETTARTLTLSGTTTDTLTVPVGDTVEWDGQIHVVSGTAPQMLSFNGGGTLIMGGSVDNSSLDMAINAGTVIINKNSTSTVHGIGGGTSTVANGATLQLSGSGGYDLYSSCALTVAGGGVLDLNGQTVISMSTLTLSGSGSGGLGTLINSSGGISYLTNGSGIVLAGNTTIGGNGPITTPAVISGYGMSLTQADSGLLTLGGANTFSGGLVISPNDSVQLNAAGGAGIGTIAIGANGALIFNGAVTYANAITGGSSSTIQVNLPAGNTFLTGSLSGFNGTVNVETATTTGQLVINNANNGAFPISANATWNIANGATLDLATPFDVDPASVIVNGTGDSQAYGSLRLDACNQQGNVLLNGYGCLIGDGNTSGPSTISGVISDNGYGYGFTKVGSAIPLVLTAANTYSGPTIIDFGTLALGPTGSIASSSALSLAAGTAFDVSQVSGGYAWGAGQSLTNTGGPATIVGSLNVSSGSPLTLACTNGAPALNVTNGTLTLANNPITVTVLGASGPLPGTYPLITGLTGVSPGVVTGSVAGSPLTVNNPIGNTSASLVFSNNSLYLVIISSYPTLVNQLPATYGQPMSLYAGASPTFSVNAIGEAPLQYLWYTNGVVVGWATNSSLTLTNVQIGSLTTYCIVSNSIGTAPSTSWPATVLADPTAPYPVSVLALNPIGYWRLNEGPDNGAGNQGVVCNDYVSGDAGTYTNTTLAQPGYNPASDPTETSAEFGETGISFYDSYAGQIAGIDFAQPAGKNATFTIEAWVNGYSSQPNGAGLVTKGYGGGGEQFDLDYYGAYRFFVRDASGTTHGPTSTVKVDGNWHMLAGVCDEVNGAVSLYLDGALIGSSTVASGVGILEDPLPMCIGSRMSANNTNNNLQFFGFMNDVAIFNYALSASQIRAQYVSVGAAPAFTQEPAATVTVDAGVALTLPATALGTGPLSYFWYDENGGTNIAVGTVNSNTVNASLTISNVPSAWNNDTLQLTVSNAYGMTNLTVALTVSGGLTASLTPAAVVMSAGESYTYSATAAGTVPIYYQWYFGGTPVAGATNASFTAVAALGTNAVTCQVSNNYNGLTVTNVTVTLAGAPYLTLNGNGTGWAGQQTGVYSNTPVAFNNGALILTDGSTSEARSFFFANPQYIGAFAAAFTYQFAPGSSAVPADGVTFCLQNDPRGTTALATGGGDFGVGSTGVITPSFELELNLYNSATGGSGYSVNTNGTIGPNTHMGALVLTNGHPIGITLSYVQGQDLSITFTDAVASTSFSTNLPVGNIPSLLGGSLAYVGFTGGDGSDDAVQTVSNFQFISLMSLMAQPAGTNMVAAWPAGVSLYQLQSNTDLTTTNWVNVGNAVVQTNGWNEVTVPVSGAAGYYRLQLQ